MPNWCNNVISVTADDDNLPLINELILDANKEVDFNRAHPMPDIAENLKDKGSWLVQSSIAGWTMANWGVRGNAHHTKRLDNSTTYFSTAYSPPTQWFFKLAEILSERNLKCEVKLQWGEPGANVGGELYVGEDYEVDSTMYNNKQLNEFLGGSDDPHEDIIGELKTMIGTSGNIKVLDVAVGHLHDLLYDHYSDELTFTDNNGDNISIKNLTEPDGVMVRLYGNNRRMSMTHLTDTLGEEIISLELLQSEDISPFVDLIVKLTDLFNEHNIDVEKCDDYG